MMEPQFLPIDTLDAKRYSILFDYPRADFGISSDRISILSDMGVDGISFAGSTQLQGIPILGKGHSGIVLLALLNNQRVALKIKRSDSVRDTMVPEARLLKLANGVDVGPRLLEFHDDIIVMEYLSGFGIGEWILNIVSNAQQLKHVIRHILKDCFRLDCLGLDHGELTNIYRHVIINNNNTPTLIDFESSSLDRRVSNVTSATQSMLINSALASKIHTIYDSPKPSTLIPELRIYKRNPSYATFQRLLDVVMGGDASTTSESER